MCWSNDFWREFVFRLNFTLVGLKFQSTEKQVYGWAGQEQSDLASKEAGNQASRQSFVFVTIASFPQC